MLFALPCGPTWILGHELARSQPGIRRKCILRHHFGQRLIESVGSDCCGEHQCIRAHLSAAHGRMGTTLDTGDSVNHCSRGVRLLVLVIERYFTSDRDNLRIL